jgi:nucleoside-diphosphate-sugar epimerase
MPVEIVDISSRDPATLRAAASGCQHVFHCAHDWARPEVNLELGVRLVEAAAAAGVESLVYLSTLSVYYPTHADVITEQSPWLATDVVYALNKREVTNLILGAAERTGLRVTVLEPPCVYGPFSDGFAVYPISSLRSARVVVPPEHNGTCNLVYVDDVVRAMVMAAESPASAGERLIITGPSTISWLGFYKRFASMIGTGQIVVVESPDVTELPQSASAAERARRVWRDPGRMLSSARASQARRLIRRAIGEIAWQHCTRVVPRPLLLPTPEDRVFRWASAVASGQKAARALGFTPDVDIDEGMAHTAAFVSWSRL